MTTSDVKLCNFRIGLLQAHCYESVSLTWVSTHAEDEPAMFVDEEEWLRSVKEQREVREQEERPRKRSRVSEDTKGDEGVQGEEVESGKSSGLTYVLEAVSEEHPQSSRPSIAPTDTKNHETVTKKGSPTIKQSSDLPTEPHTTSDPHLIAYLIDRQTRTMSPYFHKLCDQISQEVLHFVKLFDKFGKLKSRYYDTEYYEGGLTFGDEMDVGDLCFVEEVWIPEEVRGRGVGRYILGQLVECIKEHRLSVSFVVVRPRPLQQDLPPNCKDEEVIKSGTLCATRFWQTVYSNSPYFPASIRLHISINNSLPTPIYTQLGFRRIGKTPYLAYALNPSHRSHSLPITDDLPWAEKDISFLKDSCKFPIHKMIATQLATASVSHLHQLFTTQHNFNPNQPNSAGNTLLHIACAHGKTAVVHLLLSYTPGGRGLTNAAPGVVPVDVMLRTVSGATALDFYVIELENQREYLDAFYKAEIPIAMSQGDATALVKLKARMGLIDEEEERGFINDLAKLWGVRYWCECGPCAGGFVSGRLGVKLWYSAFILSQVIREDLSEASEGDFAALDSMRNWWMYAYYLPTHLRNRPTRFYRGYHSCFQIIKSLLEQNTPPTLSSICEFPSTSHDTTPFVHDGGVVEYALKAVLDKAEKAEDRGVFSPSEENPDREIAERIRALPMCRNDGDYLLVRNVLLRGSRVDPYWPYGEFRD
ncbi:hypothetical protein HDV00_005241 [Rhizophlyctis rosea]|nr:hypothetical protein HDV00_005241 [Rhizophlyctis rosea]